MICVIVTEFYSAALIKPRANYCSFVTAVFFWQKFEDILFKKLHNVKINQTLKILFEVRKSNKMYT